MAGIRLIVILCVLLMFSGSISDFLYSFPNASRIPSFKGSSNSKQCALTSKIKLSFFEVVISK